MSVGLNYLWQADGAAERDGYSNVVTHPEVDCVDTASHVDHLMQGFTLICRAEEDNEEESLLFKTQTEHFTPLGKKRLES